MHENRDSDQTGTGDRTPESGAQIEDIVAANQELRERVDELETALTEIPTVDEPVGSEDDTTAAASSGQEAMPDDAGLLTSGGQPTKVIGRLSDTDGIGVLGEATGTGATNGVRGVAGSSSGYGLYTPDDAKAEGSIEAGVSVDTNLINLSDAIYADSEFQVY